MGGEVKLRVLHVLVQPVLVWDDGVELEPGPQVDAVALPVSQLSGFVDGLSGEVEKLEQQLTQQQP